MLFCYWVISLCDLRDLCDLRTNLKAFPMMRREPQGFNRFPMVQGAIAFIGVPMVIRVLGVEVDHIIIPVGFGQYAGSRNRSIGGVPFDDALMHREGIRTEQMAINQDESGPGLELVKGKVHGLERGFQDVDPVNLFLVNTGHGPGEGFLPDHIAQQVAVLFFHLFGVIQQGMPEPGRQDYGRRENRTGETAAASFIAAGFNEVFLEERSKHIWNPGILESWNSGNLKTQPRFQCY